MAGVEGATRKKNKPVSLFLAKAGSNLFAVCPTKGRTLVRFLSKINIKFF